jgi:hypothetical protein
MLAEAAVSVTLAKLSLVQHLDLCWHEPARMGLLDQIIYHCFLCGDAEVMRPSQKSTVQPCQQIPACIV